MTDQPHPIPSTGELVARARQRATLCYHGNELYCLLTALANRLQSLTERERDVRAMIAAAPTPPHPVKVSRKEIAHALRDTCARMEVRENILDADVMVYADRYADAILALLSPQGGRP